MPVTGSDCQTAAAVYRKIVMRMYGSAHPIRDGVIRVGVAAGDGIGTSFCKRKENLICLLHLKSGIIAAADINPVKQQVYLGGIISIDYYAAVIKSPGEYIFTCSRYIHVTVVRIYPVAVRHASVPGECDIDSSFGIP